MNPDCAAKKIRGFTLFASRDAMNIDGLSQSTLEKFIAMGFIHEFADIFQLDRHKDAIIEMEGFGEKSYENLILSLDKARNTTLSRVIYSLGIPGIGLANAKVICRHFKDDLSSVRQASMEEISAIEGIGPVLAGNIYSYFHDKENNQKLDRLMGFLILHAEAASQTQIFAGVTFVITGSVTHFANRNEMKALIESLGGKVTGSVTGKTTYLINNDTMSNSSKNKKAKELGIPIISEEEFLKLVHPEEA